MNRLIENLVASFERLSKREQGMVTFLAVALFTLVVGGGSFLVSRDLDKREKRIAAKQAQLLELGALRMDYQRRLDEQQRLANQIRQNNGVRLLSYIEEIAKRSEIEMGNAQERNGELAGSTVLKEEAAEIAVKNVSIDRLYDFLKRLEEGNNLVKVRHLRVRKRFDNPKRLDATITIGTFKTTT
jgi:hypothetical protein